MTDHAVNEWTRNDLPGVHWPGIHGESERQGAEKALDAVVAHLNTHHPKPDGDLQAVVNEGVRMKRLYNEQRIAREQAERERDQARDERDEAREQARAASIGWMNAADRAEAAEARTAPAVTKVDIEKVLRESFTNYYGPLRTTHAVCDLLGIEAATDPVEDKARELWEVVKPSVYATWSGTNEKAKDQFRKVAAHVLGQEANDGR